MSAAGLQSIAQNTFRANPSYELVLFDRLPPQQRAALSDLRKDPDFFGVLLPRGQAALAIKSVCRDTALLFLTLREPGSLPAYVQTLFGERYNHEIAELVLDGVLEIERDSGTFVSGAAAYELVCEPKLTSSTGGTIARLSIEALRYASALEITDPLKLSARMYCHNRRPLSPTWSRRFPTSTAVAEHLGVHEGGSNAALLDRYWSKTSPSGTPDGWYMWSPRNPERADRTGRVSYKLYVSPKCEAVKDAFRATIAVLAELGAPHFKVGKNVYGLLRPDKLVVYLGTLEELHETSDRLTRELEGIPAHGVPFTAEIVGDGLLSWGIDPPREEQVLGWMPRESWRLWVTNRLAAFLLAAKTDESGTVEPRRFALERLRLEGVDTHTWAPAATMWRDGFMREG